jgi:hypothetical protein
LVYFFPLVAILGASDVTSPAPDNDTGSTPHAEPVECTGDRFIDRVIRSMPQGYEIPCAQVVAITDFRAFLRSRPDLLGRPAIVEKAHRSIAFTIDSTWPIYFNAE